MTDETTAIRIIVANEKAVNLDIMDQNNSVIDQYRGELGFATRCDRIRELNKELKDEHVDSEKLDELGSLLFETLFDKELRTIFWEYYNKHSGNDKRLLRVMLDISQEELPELAALPWELMHDPRHGPIYLATSPVMTLTRYCLLKRHTRSLTLGINDNLRIALVISTPNGLEEVEGETILSELKKMELLERISVFDVNKIVEKQNKKNIDGKQIIELLLEEKPHVVHFIGHGRFIQKNNRNIYEIALMDFAKNPHWVSAKDFAECLNRHIPGLVFLQSCNSGAISPNERFATVAEQVVQMNVPAVIAMQLPVSNSTGQRFALEFYQHLLDGSSVDCAVQMGRRKITSVNGFESSFATPIIFMNSSHSHLFSRELEREDKKTWMREQEDRAKKCKQNGAFGDAHKAYKGIRYVDPTFPNIDSILEDLKEKIKNQNRIQEILEKFESKLPDKSNKIYDNVVGEFDRFKKEGVFESDDQCISLLNQFINDELSFEEFAEQWSVEDEGERQLDVSEFKMLTESLMDGDLIPFLGAQFLHCWSSEIPPVEELRDKVAGKVGFDNFKGSFDMIAQYYVNKGHSRRKILNEIQQQIAQSSQECIENPLFDMIAEADRPMLVISASPDDFLETRLRQKNKPFAVLTHLLNPLEETDAGKIQVHYHDEEEPEPPCISEDLSRLKLMEKNYSIIYKIYGILNDDEPERRLLTENDFFVFARYLEKQIPPYVIRKFRTRTFLFLGYNLDSWQDRLLAYTFLEKKRKYQSSNFCAAVWKKKDKYQEDFWEDRKVKLYPEKLPNFIHQFSSTWEEVQAGGPDAE